jgi:hypothetical protein
MAQKLTGYGTGTLVFMFLKFFDEVVYNLSVSIAYHCNCLDSAYRLHVASPYCNVLP